MVAHGFFYFFSSLSAAALFASAPPPLKAALETVDRSGSLAVFTTTSLSEAHSFASAARDGIAQLLLDDSREVFEHHHDWGAFTDIVCGLCALVAAYAAVFLTHVQTLTLHAVDDAATLERAALLCVKFTARFPLAAIARVRRGGTCLWRACGSLVLFAGAHRSLLQYLFCYCRVCEQKEGEVCGCARLAPAALQRPVPTPDIERS
jgi:hypothetical protein